MKTNILAAAGVLAAIGAMPGSALAQQYRAYALFFICALFQRVRLRPQQHNVTSCQGLSVNPPGSVRIQWRQAVGESNEPDISPCCAAAYCHSTVAAGMRSGALDFFRLSFAVP